MWGPAFFDWLKHAFFRLAQTRDLDPGRRGSEQTTFHSSSRRQLHAFIEQMAKRPARSQQEDSRRPARGFRIEKIEKSRNTKENQEIRSGDQEIEKSKLGAPWAARASRRPAGGFRIEEIKKSRNKKEHQEINAGDREIENSKLGAP